MTDQSERPTRAEKVAEERRKKRGGMNALAGQKLAVPEKFLDRANFEYRWINDDGGRIQALTEMDDYDLVHDPRKEGKKDTDGNSSLVSKIVGKNDAGQPVRAYLARKPKHYYQEDQAEKQNLLDEKMGGIKRGVPQGEGAQLGGHAYVPEGSINIREGQKA